MTLLALFGGLALLLYGVQLIGEGLQRAAGGHLRHLVTTMTRSRLTAVGSGALVTALTQSYYEWGLAHAGRTAGPFDRVFPMAYVAAPPAPAAQRSADEFWQAQGIDPSQFVVAFVGTMGRL